MNLPISICPTAVKLWGRKWGSQVSVKISEFVELIQKEERIGGNSESFEQCIFVIFNPHLLLAKAADAEISLDQFSKLLKWFGSIKQGGDDIFEMMLTTAKLPWFFGVMSREEAELKLEAFKSRPGTYLVRLNSGSGAPIESCPYTISRVVENGEYVHTRVQPSQKAPGFWVKLGNTKVVGKNLMTLIANIQIEKLTECSSVCTGHPFANVGKASAQKLGAYDCPTEEEETSKKTKEEKTADGSKKSSQKPKGGSKKPKSSTKKTAK